MTKHTPGPWRVVEKTHESTADRFGRVTQTRSVFINGANGAGSLAKMYVGHQDADARLIAAAPELLEALQRAQVTLLCASRGRLTPDEINDAAYQAGDVIARATGDK